MDIHTFIAIVYRGIPHQTLSHGNPTVEEFLTLLRVRSDTS